MQQTRIDQQCLYMRKIIHFDLDAFYASVEMRDDPSLRHRPVIIGGSPQSRSVVCTANYEARKFGVRSAIPCSQAYRLCPQAVFLRPNFQKYRAVSEAVRRIFSDYTDLIEPLSLDEAYLDVTHDTQGRFATRIAVEIQKRVEQELEITGSAGVAPNKMIAKIASDYRKPNGITVVQPHQVEAFVGDLPLRKIPGIGPASEERLVRLGYHRCRDLWPHQAAELHQQLGERMGQWLYWRSRGIDHRQVQPHRERKSIGMERTFAQDLSERSSIEQILREQVDELYQLLQRKNLSARTWTLKVKYFDFQLCTRSKSRDVSQLPKPTELYETFEELLGKTEVGQRKIRLLGVGCSKLSDCAATETSKDSVAEGIF